MTQINVDNDSIDLSQVITNVSGVDLSLENPIYSGGKINDIQSGVSIVAPVGLVFNTSLSNGKLSQDYSINNFTIFNSYIHNDPNPSGGQGVIEKTAYAFTINTSQFLNTAVSGFNTYSLTYRG